MLVARDRTKQTFSQVVTFGRLDAATLDQVLTSCLQPGVILCTDEEPTFRKYCRACLTSSIHFLLRPTRKPSRPRAAQCEHCVIGSQHSS